MKKFIQIGLMPLVVLLFTSCYIKGLTNGYKQLGEEEKKLIVFDSNKNVGIYTDTIYAYNGLSFKKNLLLNNKTLIYLWDPNCSSKSCIALPACQYYCDQNGYELVVLLQYFDLPKQKKLGEPTNSIIISDFKYYNTKIADKSTNLFLKDLTNINSKDTLIRYKRFLFFEKDKFVQAKESLF